MYLYLTTPLFWFANPPPGFCPWCVYTCNYAPVLGVLMPLPWVYPWSDRYLTMPLFCVPIPRLNSAQELVCCKPDYGPGYAYHPPGFCPSNDVYLITPLLFVSFSPSWILPLKWCLPDYAPVRCKLLSLLNSAPEVLDDPSLLHHHTLLGLDHLRQDTVKQGNKNK